MHRRKRFRSVRVGEGENGRLSLFWDLRHVLTGLKLLFFSPYPIRPITQ
jgi:hypothetical protein